MEPKGKLVMRGVVLLVLCLSALGGVTQPVSADTCTWDGWAGTPDWNNAGNWTCGHVPTQDDDVIIPSVTGHDPIAGYRHETGEWYIAHARTVTIESGGRLAVGGSLYLWGLSTTGPTLLVQEGGELASLAVSMGGGVTMVSQGASPPLIHNHGTVTANYSLSIGGYGSFVNQETGTIAVNQAGYSEVNLSISVDFDNLGEFNINSGIAHVRRSGTHSGEFWGEPGTVLSIGALAGANTFGPTSDIRVPRTYFAGGTTRIQGVFWPPATGSRAEINGTVIFENLTAAFLPEQVVIRGGDLVLEQGVATYTIAQLALDDGTLTNNTDLTVSTSFSWRSGSLSGTGTTEIDRLAALTYAASVEGVSTTKTLDGHHLIQQGPTAWNNGTIVLANGAVFENGGTFDANATTTMQGTGTFVNDGKLRKFTAGTATTIAVPFVNNGEIQRIEGSLVFTNLLTAKDGVIDLGGGTLSAGDTLTVTEGSSLIGSGTLESNLVNSGTVSPGVSPGRITVNGDYTQEVSGTLAIELGGLMTAAEYDQLVVTGTAALAGHLDVSLIDAFAPSAGDTFTITTYTERTGTFDTVTWPAAPAGGSWYLDYGAGGVTLYLAEQSNAGTISGMIICTGSLRDSSHDVFVDLYATNVTPPPNHTQHTTCGGTYLFDSLPDSTYYVAAWLDLDDSGSGPPSETEPQAWYGTPDPVTIADGVAQTRIDVTLEGNAITSPDHAVITVGDPAVFTVTATGSPSPTISLMEGQSDDLPSGISFDPGIAEATLSGIADARTEGIYLLAFSAANGVAPDATQIFTLTVSGESHLVYLPLVTH